MLHELHKWVNFKSIIIFLLVLALNVLLFIRNSKYQDQNLLEDYENYERLLAGQDLNEPEAGNSAETDFSAKFTSAAELEYKQQKEYIENYPLYILSMPQRAESAYALSGETVSAYEERNVNKTVADFSGLEDLELELGRDKQVIRPFASKLSDLILIALVLLLASNIFTQEYSAAIYPLLTATKARSKIAWHKIFSLLIITFFLCLGIYGSNILSSAFIYGWDKGQRLVQAIPEFRTLAIPMTVNQYFLLALGIKFINAFALSLILLALYTWLKKAIPVISLTIIFALIAYTLYISIPANAKINTLHFINPIHGFDAYNLIRTYQNINILGKPVESLVVWLVVCLLVIILSSILIIKQFKTAAIIRPAFTWSKAEKLKDKMRKQFDQLNTHGGVFAAEFRKSLFSNKALLILIILALFLTYRVRSSYQYSDSKQLAYNYYIDKFSGPVTAETLDEIDQEYELISQAKSLQDLKQEAFTEVESQAQRVLDLEAKSSIKAYLINDLSYARAMDNPSKDLQDVMLVFLITIIISSGLFAKENEVDTKRLIRICPAHKSLRASKLSISIIYALIIGAMVEVSRVLILKKFNDYEYLNAAIQNHLGCEDFPFAWSFRQYFIAMLLFRFAAYISLAFLISLISAYAKSENIAVIIATCVSLIPALALYLNITVLEKLSLAWVAQANTLLKAPVATWIWAIVLLLGICLLSYFAIKKDWQPQR